MANRGAHHRKWLAPTLEGVTDSGIKRVVGSPFLRHVFWASKKCDSRRAPLPKKKCGLIGARNGYHWHCLVDWHAPFLSSRSSGYHSVIPAKAGIQYLGMDSGSPFHYARNDGVGCFVFPLCQVHEHGWRPAGFGPLPRGRVPFCLQQQKGTKKFRPLIPLFPALLGPTGGRPTHPFARPTQAIPGLPLRA